VSRGFQLTSLDRVLTKPLFLAKHLDDRDTIAHAEAVDDYMAHMFAYPGRTFGQLYHAFFRVNSLAGGRVALHGDEWIDLADVRQPVLSVAGAADVLAPAAAVHHVGELLRNAAEVRLETSPGGHLGVLTGRSARSSTWEYLDDFLAGHDPMRNRPSSARTAESAADASSSSQRQPGAQSISVRPSAR